MNTVLSIKIPLLQFLAVIRSVVIPDDEHCSINYFSLQFLAVKNDGPPTMRHSYVNTPMFLPLPL